MALQITQPITSREGHVLSSYYQRIEILLCKCGKKIEAEVYSYKSKELFLAGADTICKNEVFYFDYDAATEGTDLLLLAHTKLVEKLTTSQGEDENGDPLPPTFQPETVGIVDV